MRAFTLHDVIERNATQHGARTAFVFEGERVTHAQYADRVRRLAAGLACAGVAAGDRMAILAGNCMELLDLLGAAARIGAVLVPINTRLSLEEIAHVVTDAAPKVVVASMEFESLLPCELPVATVRYLLDARHAVGRSFADLYVDSGAPPAVTNDEYCLLLLYTAATAGKPRGAMLSHRGLVAANLHALIAWGLKPTDMNLCALPLFHLAGLGWLLAMLQAGGATVVMGRFEAKVAAQVIDRERVTLMGTYAPMLGALLDAAEHIGSRLPSLTLVTGLDTPETIARLHVACPGARFWSIYGQTETTGVISLAPWGERPGSAGRAGLGTVAIVDDLDRPLRVGDVGEIVVRGPMVFLGYWKRDEDNAETFRNGWHHTGDLGRVDADGYLWYVGRSPAKELIKSGGENVYPAEVERAILAHPGVAETVVIGVPDAAWGEAVKAICVLRPGITLTAAALIDFVGTRIARYKKPKRVAFVPALPRTTSGLVDRAAVKSAHGGA